MRKARKVKSRTFLFGCGGNTQSLMQRPHVTRVCVCVCVCVCGVCVRFVKLHSIYFSSGERKGWVCGEKGSELN